MGDESFELGPPLPGLATRATVTFLTPKQGLLGRSKPTSRAEADRAAVRVEGPGDQVVERELSLAELDAWQGEVEAFRARVAAKRTANEAERRSPEEHAAMRAERRASITPRCPYCDAPREYRGVRNLVTSGRPDGFAHADPAYWGRGMEAAHLYACSTCGSVEWFSVGPLEHPLG